MELLILLLLFLLNGVFSMSEIALVSARKSRLEADAQRGDARARAALGLAKDPSRFLSTVQIGITLIGILTGIYSGENVTEDLKVVLLRFPVVAPYAHGLAVAGVVIVVTFFSLILGELVPKRIGLSMPEPIAKLMALPMKMVSIITAPFIWLLTATSNVLLRLLGIKPDPGGGITEDEIRAMVHKGTEGGVVQSIEKDIVERVFTLGDRRASSLMTHRVDLVALPLEADLERIRSTVLDSVHDQYPVIRANLDDIAGVVTIRALLGNLHRSDLRLADLLTAPQYVPESVPAYQVLEQFKRSGTHYAIVVDGTGSTVGLVTLNDILQALVGDVSDFHREEYTILRRADGTWLVDGQYPLHELLVRFERSSLIRDLVVETVGGLLLHHLERIPVPGDAIEWMGLRIEVADMDGVRIDKVIIQALDA